MGLFHGVASSEFQAFRQSTYAQWSDSLVQNFIAVCLDALPFLMLGFFMAGLLKSFVADRWVMRILGNPSSWVLSPIKGAVFGAPIPLCSCSVVPVAMELKKQGANKGALTAFLVSAPETGVDSLSLSYVLLGPIMVVARLISALMTAIITAWTVVLMTGKTMPIHNTAPDTDQGICKDKTHEKGQPSPCCDDCIPQKKGLGPQFIQGQRYAFTTLLDHTFKYMMIALLFTAIMRTFVPATFLGQHSYGLFPMVLAVLVAFPMYICASAATPIAAWLILSGISPGVALVFMLAGPASNMATFMAIRHMMGGWAMVIYVVCISALSILAGHTLNTLEALYNWNIIAQTGQGYILNKEIAIALSVFVVLCAIKPLRKYWGLVPRGQ